jgi:WD40 repeat protein
VKLYNGPANGTDLASSDAVSPDGTKVFVTGSSYGSASGSDFATIAYDATTRAKLWVSRYDGLAHSDDVARALAVSPDGSEVFVTGASLGSRSRFDYTTVAYDASTGTELWARRYTSPAGNDFAEALGVSPDGTKLFVTGRSRGSTSGWDYATVAYIASTGSHLWTKRYNGPGDAGDFAHALGVSPDGSTVFVTGRSDGSTDGPSYATLAYDAGTGAKLWLSRYDGPGPRSDAAAALGVSPDGTKVFVTGQSARFHTDYGTVAYDAATGAQLWVARYNGPSSDIDEATALSVSPDGTEVFVTGSSYGATSGYDYATAAYDAATGAELWVTRYDSTERAGSTDFANDIAVSPDGTEVFVTGQSAAATSATFDYATAAYNTSSGAELWVSRYNGPADGTDAAYSVAPSPDGTTLFVTGGSDTPTRGFDYLTVAYRV